LRSESALRHIPVHSLKSAKLQLHPHSHLWQVSYKNKPRVAAPAIAAAVTASLLIPLDASSMMLEIMLFESLGDLEDLEPLGDLEDFTDFGDLLLCIALRLLTTWRSAFDVAAIIVRTRRTMVVLESMMITCMCFDFERNLKLIFMT
jgi:hypothetical protein